ncbi:MAG TPA: asparagine synthase (glutamine-hydrolyzing) [Bryobacteraceae bacterium]|jgi:asparagine synthase (glutamine-hydrolysing)|nr:asparagine synthase (glutamine-hydrolyzing) [Bryobacteraceae bacterium]
MCGIAGFTHGRRPAAPGRIQSAVAAIVHRGPNQQGVFESEAVSLGAARLKIIDIEGGDQPIKSADGQTVIVFNGEIYNHLELRRELESRGYTFHSRSDTETVLNAFLEWDTECFARLRGMFAVALWNESGRRLVLARDRMGIKPLYIARRGEDLYFGSELKTILIHPEIERRLSLEGLDCYLSLNYVPAPWTLVDGIEKLLPGQWLEWKSGKTRTEHYWRLPQGKADRWTPVAAEAELDRLLRESVREHLMSDVPLGVWLSGGLDSSTVVHYASEALGSSLKTFSVTFRGRSFDETPYVRQVAKVYGTDHTELDLNPEQDLPAAIHDLAYYSDEPNADSGALPVWFLSQMTKAGATVALSGEGADELFGGYLTQRASLLAARARRLPPAILKTLLATARRLPVSNDKIGFEYKLKRFLEGSLLPAARAHVYWGGTFSDKEKRTLLKMPLPPALDSVLANLAGEDLHALLEFDQRYFLPDNILTKVDRTSMAHAVEVRPPFLDHRIVEFASSLPSAMKIHGAKQKVILRNLMRGKLSPEVLTRKKIGFDIPAHDWFRGTLRPLLEESIAFASAEHGEFFQMPRIEAQARAHFERRANLGYHLWGLMTLFFWMKKWRIQTGMPVSPAGRTMENVFTST